MHTLGCGVGFGPDAVMFGAVAVGLVLGGDAYPDTDRFRQGDRARAIKGFHTNKFNDPRQDVQEDRVSFSKNLMLCQ